MHTYQAAPDVDVVTSTATIAGFGQLAINAFVIHADEPVLVDTGSLVESNDFMTALRSVIDPADLRWIWLTHTDFDHIGSLQRLLDENERLRVITSFLGVGIMSLSAPLPMDRVYLINPGQSIDVGDRSLSAVRPPAFDNPITVGLHDTRSGIFFSSDCFGALLDEVPESAEDVSADVTAPRSGLLGHGGLLVAAQGGPVGVRLGVGPRARARANHGLEQSPAGRTGLIGGAVARCARRGSRRPCLRRTGPGRVGADAGRGDGVTRPGLGTPCVHL